MVLKVFVANVKVIIYFLGLSVVLDIEQLFYMKNGLTKGAGVRVAFHDPRLK